MKINPEIITTLKDKRSFLGHVHLSPDPDTIGSVLALKLALEGEGKVVNLFCEDPLIEAAAFLPEVGSIKQTSMASALKQNHEVYLCLDTAKWELATHNQHRPEAPVVVVDHHPDNSINTPLHWLDVGASSTAQMVYQLIKALELKVTPQIATCLLFGLLGDTGMFQHTNTSKSDFILTAELVELGADYHQTVLHLARSYSAVDLASMGKALERIKLSDDGSFALMSLDFKAAKSLSGEPRVGYIANQFAGRISGTQFGAVLVEKKPGVTKGSLRSRLGEFDVSRIARELGGGGHKNSASFKLELAYKEAEKEFMAAVAKVKKQNG
jgi:phosphoesterase RecJ-like protein